MCDCEPEPDELAEMLIRTACAAGVHDTRTLGPCPHSSRPSSPLVAFIVTEALSQLRMSLAMSRLVNRAYDMRSL